MSDLNHSELTIGKHKRTPEQFNETHYEPCKQGQLISISCYLIVSIEEELD
jgi:hypothetical protein